MRDITLFSQAIDVTYPVYAAFEQGPLMSFYRRVAEAIRAVDTSHILFIESSMGSNMGVYSALEPLTAQGQVDPQQAYAPHGYDLVVDTPYLAEASPERIALIFSRHAETARRLNVPMLVGEWGAFNRATPNTLPAAWAVSRQFERLLCSDLYWHYAPDLDQFPVFQAISRPYPARVSGELCEYGYAEAQGSFNCAWEERPGDAPSIFYLPGWLNPQAGEIQLQPVGTVFQTVNDGHGLWLSIPPLAQPARRSLVYRSSEALAEEAG
jgi:endoglycosylceramidase